LTTQGQLMNLKQNHYRLQKMLASTMQFSSNRRTQEIPPRIRGTRPSWPLVEESLFPQDSTVCSPGPAGPGARSTPEGIY